MGRMGGNVCLNKVVVLLLLSVNVGFAAAATIGPSSGGRKKLRYSFDDDGQNDVGYVPLPESAPVNGTCKSRVEIYGYRCEDHTVTTKDGYILSIQRIPKGRASEPSGATRAPVLLQHGLMMDGITWLLNSPDESLGYILADSGYDVWIANTRGTIYSLGHTSLSPDDPAYWNWSWDELVTYDLPAVQQYIYQQVGQQKMHYVGHSLGTLIALASLTLSQQNDDVVGMLRSAALLSPITYLSGVSSPVAREAAESFTAEAFYWLGLDEFNPNGEPVHKLLTNICNLPGINCYDLLTAITGKNCCLNSSSIHLFLDHEPQPTATKNMIHLAQMVRGGTIAKYDYGNENENLEHYGRATPPAYNISAIPSDFPLFLSYGGQDTLSDLKDVEHLLNSLKDHDGGDKLTIQFLDNYAHADFVMAVNAKQSVYDPLIAFFKLQED